MFLTTLRLTLAAALLATLMISASSVKTESSGAAVGDTGVSHIGPCADPQGID